MLRKLRSQSLRNPLIIAALLTLGLKASEWSWRAALLCSHHRARFSNAELSASLGAAIKRAVDSGGRDDGSAYYNHVLDALEQIVLEKSLVSGESLSARKEAWRAAYTSTPHGQPVLLNPRS